VERATTVVPPQLRAYTLSGTLVSGPHALSGTSGALTRMGLHFIREATTIGGQGVAAGSLIYLRDATLYVLDKTDGSVIVSEAVNPGFDTGGLCTNPLNGGGKGLGYSTRLDRFLTTSSCCNCSGIAEFIGNQTTGFIPLSVPATGGAGSVKERPSTGNLWVVNAPNSVGLSVVSEARVLLREFVVADADTLGPVASMRLAFDTSGSRLWLLSTSNGDIFELDITLPQPLPTLSPSAWLVLVLVLGGSALHLARRNRARAA
jgi:hypothetical protein